MTSAPATDLRSDLVQLLDDAVALVEKLEGALIDVEAFVIE